jgi:hypothetical protein
VILAIDPGNEKSAFVMFKGERILDKDIWKNDDLIPFIKSHYHNDLVIEMVASYGMAVGRTVFETCVWIGRFIQANNDGNKKDIPYHLVYRKDIKMHLCQSMRAKDSNIMQALKDRYGEVGCKSKPGPLYGVKKDIWSALAVATYYNDTRVR